MQSYVDLIAARNAIARVIDDMEERFYASRKTSDMEALFTALDDQKRLDVAVSQYEENALAQWLAQDTVDRRKFAPTTEGGRE